MKRKIRQWLERTVEPKKGCFVCVCVHFNIKDVSMNLAIINEGKTKIKYNANASTSAKFAFIV